MRKIKYQGGLTKLITSKIAKQNKFRFGQYIEKNLAVLQGQWKKNFVPMEIVSFSSGSDFYDQILSILSLLRHVGTPISWTVYSDGSHSEKQKQLLTSGFEFVKVVLVNWDDNAGLQLTCKEALLPYKSHLLDYARKQPLGKRLFLYLNHPINNTTLFLDADVLFYNRSSLFYNILQEKVNGWYLPEENWGCLDSRYTNRNAPQLYQVNGGFLLFNKELTNINEGMEFLKSLNHTYEYFTEQTVIHILLRNNAFIPLDPRIFIINSKDQFDFSYLFPREEIAIRHYTGPVRHKMWQRTWKWHLSIS